MEDQPIKLEKKLVPEAVDKVLWERHLDQLAQWILAECARTETKCADSPTSVDTHSSDNASIDKYGQEE